MKALGFNKTLNGFSEANQKEFNERWKMLNIVSESKTQKTAFCGHKKIKGKNKKQSSYFGSTMHCPEKNLSTETNHSLKIIMYLNVDCVQQHIFS